MDEVLHDNFNNEITKILSTSKGDNSFNNKITIACYKYHAGVLEYLVNDN